MRFFIIHKKLLVLVIFLVVGFVIYGNSFNNELFWDDDDNVVNNVYIKNWDYLPNYFTENLISGSGQVTDYYRPILEISFAFDYHLWGLNSFGFHLTNVCLHIIAAWLTFILLFKLLNFKKYYSERTNLILSFLAGLFFLVHPIQTEAVTLVAARADPLSYVFGFLAILCYVNFRTPEPERKIWDWRRGGWQYGGSILFFLLALLTREQVIILPALVLLVELFFLAGKLKRDSLGRTMRLLLPWFLISGIYFFMRLTVLDFNDILHGFSYGDIYDGSVGVRLLTFAGVMVRYYLALFFPWHLPMSPAVPVITTVFNLPVFLFIISLLVLAGLCILTAKKNKLVLFGGLWFFAVLLPHANVIQIHRPMYLHWLYLAMFGFWLAIFCSLIYFYERIKDRNVKLARPLLYIGGGAIIIAVVFFGTRTIIRNNDWQDPITFYEKNLVYAPDSFIQRNNLGMAYDAVGRHEEAIAEYQKALAIKDVYAQVHHNLANSLRDVGRTEEAILEYNRAIEMSPGFVLPYNGLLAIYMEANDLARVEEVLARMRVVLADSPDYLYVAGITYYNFSQYRRAVETWRQLLDKEPDNTAVRDLINQAKSLIK